jgi:hypothetical protein
MNYVAKSQKGNYWCGQSLGWVLCRYCAVKMSRSEAHSRAHAVSGTVVRVVRPSSHSMVTS